MTDHRVNPQDYLVLSLPQCRLDSLLVVLLFNRHGNHPSDPPVNQVESPRRFHPSNHLLSHHINHQYPLQLYLPISLPISPQDVHHCRRPTCRLGILLVSLASYLLLFQQCNLLAIHLEILLFSRLGIHQ